MLPFVHLASMRAVPSPEEQLRLALVDLQKANLHFVQTYGDPQATESAARSVDEARSQASRWAALVKAADRLDE